MNRLYRFLDKFKFSTRFKKRVLIISKQTQKYNDMNSDEFLLYFTEISTQYHRNNRFLILTYTMLTIFFFNGNGQNLLYGIILLMNGEINNISDIQKLESLITCSFFILPIFIIVYTIKKNNRLYKEKLLLERINEKRRLNEILRSKS